jgi:hypothetical protein
VMCLKCVIMKPRRNEEAQAHIGLSSHRRREREREREKRKERKMLDWHLRPLHPPSCAYGTHSCSKTLREEDLTRIIPRLVKKCVKYEYKLIDVRN